MRTLLFFILIGMFRPQVFASTYQLQQQMDCLCAAQISCDSTKPQTWIFSHRPEKGNVENYLVHSGSGKPKIYIMESPRLGKGQSLDSAMAWVEVGSGKQIQHIAVTYDLSGRIRHQQILKQSPLSFRKDLENWREAKRLENLLVLNGIPLERQGLQPGTWLLRQSDRVGLLPAQGLTSKDQSLTDVIQRYDDESREPSLKRARDFQKEQRHLFSSCSLGGGLCRGGALDPIPLKEAMNPKLMRQWQPVFERYLNIYLNQSQKPRPDVCPGLMDEQMSRSRDLDLPSAVEPAGATRP